MLNDAVRIEAIPAMQALREVERVATLHDGVCTLEPSPVYRYMVSVTVKTYPQEGAIAKIESTQNWAFRSTAKAENFVNYVNNDMGSDISAQPLFQE